MALKHELSRAGAGIPELHAAVLGTGEHPVGIGGECNGEDKVAMTLKRLDALATLGLSVGTAARAGKLPHLDGSVQRTRDEVLAVGRKGHRVNGILVSVRSLETLHEEARVNVPHADALIERTSGDILGVGRNGNSRDTILNSEGQSVGARLDIPKSYGSVAGARCDGAAVAGKVERVNILLVAREVVANSARLNVPDLVNG